MYIVTLLAQQLSNTIPQTVPQTSLQSSPSHVASPPSCRPPSGNLLPGLEYSLWRSILCLSKSIFFCLSKYKNPTMKGDFKDVLSFLRSASTRSVRWWYARPLEILAAVPEHFRLPGWSSMSSRLLGTTWRHFVCYFSSKMVEKVTKKLTLTLKLSLMAEERKRRFRGRQCDLWLVSREMFRLPGRVWVDEGLGTGRRAE